MTLKPLIRHSSRCLTKKMACYVTLLMFLGYSPFIIYDTYVTFVEMEFYKLHMEDMACNANEFQCIIPEYDPNDPRVKKYLSTSSIIRCGEPQLYLTYLDSDGYIHLNKTTIKNSGHKESDYECHYSEIFRTNKSDNKFSLGVARMFKETEKIHSSAFVLARCFLKTAKLVYETGHAYVPPPSAELYKSSRRQSDGDINHPSVLIFGLDSMSRLNFIRQLPKTYHFLTDVLGAIVFKGMTKTGDNTFPNMMALLSGINVHKRNNKTNFLSVVRPSYFDDIPLVWDSFRDSGYATMYNEDSPSLTIFNFHASGFKDPPTDYYVRPFWLAMNSINSFKSKDSRCYGNTPKHLYLLDYIEQFAARMKNHRYFAFAFLTLLSHDDLNEVQVADSDFEKMFLKMQREGQLNNTIVMVLGDHGNRFSGLRKTEIGRVEERMPFLAVSLPRDFKRRFPHLVAGLKQNQNNLLSWFDFYEMLMDLAHNNLGKKSLVQRYGTIGSSPFRWISKNRTCEQAGIPDEYCICARETQLNSNDERVKTAARDLVAYINSDLLGDAINRGLCSPLNLKHILSAQMLALGPQVAQPKGFRVLYRVMVQVMPSDALLEGTLEVDAWSKRGNTVGDVNRINRYGNQSHCITDTIMQLYCYCTDLLGKRFQNDALQVTENY
ncbi:uncharacterized protein LOC110840547 isoform X2 [Zootermopsis nevadensis]|nr:uncharacterized protein LOC110840547 isoform X2 [Zootermopsis nevadensis]XP_021941339.1 uncharacterized protein LOC110840547 isoform X2 [Zootermopsis nevadensis]XP_021941340.1 uncharacterized protein LOC110840547 isoform X2 [Zootermopsis nevadensis]XP_021941341.1 uncharacterized protein LOC110840547 isoform X2 [Zootermopsis nevadensis]XP_021941342.1 uncharacterized protein LOC110840547 isoform X2 [Zootermopsis nevadensis]XP_021941343.1 uncharacterized protein LOC110840547 isoform X2 [Zooter